MIYVYLVVSAALIPISNLFFNVLRQPYSWWLVPVLYISFVIIFCLLQTLLLIVSVATINISEPAEKGSRYYRGLFNACLIPFLKFGRVHIHTTGTDIIPENTNFLLVCNHLCDYDPIIIMSVMPDTVIGFVAKKEIYESRKFIAKMMKKLFCIPIDRENNREAVKSIIEAVHVIKDGKASIGIFPEGYTSHDGELQPFRNGAFKIACKAHVPVVTAVIGNTKPMLKNLFRRRTDVYLDFLSVTPAEELESMNTNELGDMIHLQMSDGIEKMKKRMNKEKTQ